VKKVLVIEDEHELRESIAEILTYEEFEPYTASNGLQGIKIAKEKLPDVVLCDILMPEMNGFDVLKELNKKNGISNMPFIFITALSGRNNYRQGMELGADDYLTKPFTRKELLQAISSRLKKHEEQQIFYRRKIEAFKKNVDEELKEIEVRLEEKNRSLTEVTTQKEQLGKKLDEVKTELMKETLSAIETGNTLSIIQQQMKAELRNPSLPPHLKKVLTEMHNKLNRKHFIVNNWTNFQLKFNQVYPEFIKKLTSKYPRLTQYEVVFISAHVMGLSTHQLADLFTISNDSVRKSRYRLKKKLGLNKADDFLNFIYSIHHLP
jgi:DNA-binding response OmpR family regulator